MANLETDIIDILTESPGLSGFQIHEELRKRRPPPAWAIRLLGPGSFWLEFFGPNTGSMYVALWRLEEKKILISAWGQPSARRGWRRPRHYFVNC
jgi:DNA-binding PadR family transcriptional regulator